ncbi:hypothetical protein N0V85_007998 [Neurospora sp. IMI 360204]|nr:hypothetical protein N0V85_007998 [Neurospora sp. IMI 360204]
MGMRMKDIGAAAVLDFYAIESPLSQPRNAIGGQLVSCIVGISIAKLFALSPHFESIRWLGASLACASATAVMALTGTVHPPAGATALMAVLDEQVQELGWFLIPPVMLGCAIMLVCALLVNNIRRRFPMYWWSPEKTGKFWSGKDESGEEEEVTMETEEKMGGGEKGLGGGKAGSSSEESRLGRGARSDETLREGDVDIEAQSGGTLTESGDDDDNDNEGRRKKKEGGDGDDDGDERGPRVVISRGGVKIPEGLSLRPEEVRFLETICERL